MDRTGLLIYKNILITFFVILFWWIFLYSPLKKSCLRLENEILSAKNINQIKDLNSLAIENFSEQVGVLQKEYDCKLNEIKSIPGRISLIIDLIKSSGLSFLQFTPNKSKLDKDNQFAVVTFSGTFLNIIKFFSDLDKKSCLIECVKCNISKIGKDQLHCSCIFYFDLL